MGRGVLRFSITLVVLIGVAAPVGTSAVSMRGAIHAPRHTWGRGTSTNWSGYDITGSGATQVIGSWTEPAVTCSPGETSWSSPWVGIDGDTSNTVEQIGTDSDCNKGTPTYYAWYEMYPKSLVQIPMTVTSVDSFTGEVTYNNGAFTLALTDTTTRKSFAITIADKHPQEASVEWIMEGPSGGLLSDFGTVGFSNASATINGQSGGLSSLSNPDPITMVSSKGVSRAVPSNLARDSFTVTWEHS